MDGITEKMNAFYDFSDETARASTLFTIGIILPFPCMLLVMFWAKLYNRDLFPKLLIFTLVAVFSIMIVLWHRNQPKVLVTSSVILLWLKAQFHTVKLADISAISQRDRTHCSIETVTGQRLVLGSSHLHPYVVDDLLYELNQRLAAAFTSPNSHQTVTPEELPLPKKLVLLKIPSFRQWLRASLICSILIVPLQLFLLKMGSPLSLRLFLALFLLTSLIAVSPGILFSAGFYNPALRLVAAFHGDKWIPWSHIHQVSVKAHGKYFSTVKMKTAKDTRRYHFLNTGAFCSDIFLYCLSRKGVSISADPAIIQHGKEMVMEPMIIRSQKGIYEISFSRFTYRSDKEGTKAVMMRDIKDVFIKKRMMVFNTHEGERVEIPSPGGLIIKLMYEIAHRAPFLESLPLGFFYRH